MTRTLVTLLVGLLVSMNSYSEPTSGLNTYKISKLTGMQGHYNAKENSYKIIQPREDLQISMSGVRMMPSMGLFSWISFKPIDNQTTLQGDLILTEDQISPVMEIVLLNGLHITSLENHYLWESPKVMFMHIEGSGNEASLAKATGKIFKEIKDSSQGNGNFPIAMMDVEKTTLNPHKIDAIFQKSGLLKNGVYKISLNKRNPLNEETGLNSWASFAGTDKEALVVGDITTDQSILDNVLLALHKAGFYILAIHPDLSKPNSQLVYLHYLGIGTTQKLAKGIKTALAIPIPFRHTADNKPGLTVYPIINSPEAPMNNFPNMTPIMDKNSFILNLDISFINDSKRVTPIFENTSEKQANSEKVRMMNKAES